MNPGLKAVPILVALMALAPATHAQSTDRVLSGAEREGVIETFAAALSQFYVRPSVGDSLSRSLRARALAGAFDSATTAPALARQIDRAIRDLVHDDAHLTVKYLPPPPVAEQSSQDDAVTQRAERDAFIRDARDENFGVPELRVLRGNVGYVRLGEFLYQAMMGGSPFGQPTIEAAMEFMAQRDALILDLRENRGGHTSIPGLLMSYLVDSTVVVGRTQTRDGRISEGRVVPASAPRFGGSRPLYVLTSDSTFSAGEGIAQSLKSIHRATIVGAQTRGGANSGDFHPIGAGIRAFIPDELHFDIEGHSLESLGVTPDVRVQPAEALNVAYALALEAIVQQLPPGDRRADLERLAVAAHSGVTR